ncbi:MAG: glycosyltransferase [Candidatus Marsarchaeota archaeon]|nr:glycosyltransferase [Candidatus Marsarchaeota archaeon]
MLITSEINMRCPSLTELPPPPPGRTGWPWTEESEQLPDAMLDGTSWPRVSIVTPSYNQAQFIEETIRSVLLQGYPDLEYIIIDGGSTDGSVDIIRRYEPWLAYWVSEKDRGQSEAINKGFARATGEIVAWLNSDDVYMPGGISQAVVALCSHPEASLAHGDVQIMDEVGQVTRLAVTHGDAWHLVNWLSGKGLAQQATFWRRSLFGEIGLLRPDLRFIMDYEFFLRASEHHVFLHLPAVLARFRIHGQSKTSTLQRICLEEHMSVAREYWPRIRHMAALNYWHDVRSQYGRSLVSYALSGSEMSDRHRLLVISKAFRFCPALMREGWLRKLWLKCLLGRRAVCAAQRVRIASNRISTHGDASHAQLH